MDTSERRRCAIARVEMWTQTERAAAWNREADRETDPVAAASYLRNAKVARGKARDAMAELQGLDALDSIEADSYPVTLAHPPRWFSATQGSDRYLYVDSDDDEGESRYLYLPDWVTPASRMRIARLLGCYGVEERN